MSCSITAESCRSLRAELLRSNCDSDHAVLRVVGRAKLDQYAVRVANVRDPLAPWLIGRSGNRDRTGGDGALEIGVDIAGDERDLEPGRRSGGVVAAIAAADEAGGLVVGHEGV